MSETLEEQDIPKSLLVLGNGFDLYCNLPSNYIEFLDYILKEKIGISKRELEEMGNISVIKYCSEEIGDYLNQINFAYDDVKKSDIIPELNPWYIILLYKHLLTNNDWYVIESQIAQELLSDNKKLNIIEKIGDSLLGIKFNEPVIHRAQNYALTKTGGENSIEKIYELLAYCLLYKDINRLKITNSCELYGEFRDLVKKLSIEYREVLDREPFDDTLFEQKIISELFPILSKVLLAELKELEFDFSIYLSNCLEQSGQSYYDSAVKLTHKILEVCEDEELDQESVSRFNIFSFNYTKPWDRAGQQIDLFNRTIETVNVHGIIDDNFGEDSGGYDGIVFGVDDELVLPSTNEYAFTKTSRTLDLYTDDNLSHLSHVKLSNLLVPTIENVVFFGHSLSKADYSYFRMIFDKFIENENTNFIFVYSVFKGTTREKQRRNLIQQVSSIFGDYSIEKRNNTDIFKELIQNNRIRIEEI